MTEETHGDMTDPRNIRLSFSSENYEEEIVPHHSAQDEKGRKETDNHILQRLCSSWTAALCVILMVLLLILITASVSLSNDIRQLQKDNSQLRQLLKSENKSLRLSNSMAENQKLSLRLNYSMEEKSQLQVQTEEMKKLLISTMENCDDLEKEKIKYQQFFIREQQTSMQLKAENQHQRSILLSDKLSFVWRFCNKGPLQCSRCPPGWAEHATRCFYLAPTPRNWEDARRECFSEGADLAVVLNAADQAFLTNMTLQFTQQHPDVLFHSAWIGLQDMVRDGRFMWVNGIKSKSDVKFWRAGEPNNAVAHWDKDRAGQDCVAIVPPKAVGQKGWLNSWDDIICLGHRHYLCETKALILS